MNAATITVYVLVRAEGEYGEYREETLGVFATPEGAQAEAELDHRATYDKRVAELQEWSALHAEYGDDLAWLGEYEPLEWQTGAAAGLAHLHNSLRYWTARWEVRP